MFRKILSVGGWTLVSRLTGFTRDVVLAAVMGVGPIADAFFVAFRIPNHFRAIFGEGAFNNAFLPAYAQVLETDGERSAHITHKDRQCQADHTEHCAGSEHELERQGEPDVESNGPSCLAGLPNRVGQLREIITHERHVSCLDGGR